MAHTCGSLEGKNAERNSHNGGLVEQRLQLFNLTFPEMGRGVRRGGARAEPPKSQYRPLLSVVQLLPGKELRNNQPAAHSAFFLHINASVQLFETLHFTEQASVHSHGCSTDVCQAVLLGLLAFPS